MRMATRDQVYGSVSSLVVRPSDSGGGGGANANANAIANEYEPGEIRHDEPRHRHSSSYYDRDRDRERERERDRERGRERERDRERFTPPGYNMKGYKGSVPTGSASPIHQRKVDPYEHDYDRNGRDFDRGALEFDSSAREFGRDFDYAGPARGRGFRGGRGRGRFRERTPPAMGRGRAPFGRGFSGPGYVPEPLRGETAARNNPNVAPRVGDWICSEPTCGNLNFARRTHCNNCHKPRKDIAPFNIGVVSPARGFHGPPLPLMDIPPMGRGMGRGGNGFRAPPVRWGRGGPREFDQLPPPRPLGRFSPPRPGGRFSPPRPPERFSDFRPGRVIRDRPDFRENDDYRDRDKYGRAPPGDWEFSLDSRDREREDRFHDKRGLHDTRSDRRPPSPPPRGRWERDARDRSRSPFRSSSKDYYREPYTDQRRDDKRVGRRDRFDDAY